MSKIRKLLRRSDFRHVLSFRYYDGPESGIAVYENGAAMHFEIFGESHFHILRAFILTDISGNWIEDVNIHRSKIGNFSSTVIVANEEILELENRVADSFLESKYMSILDISMEHIVKSPITNNIYYHEEQPLSDLETFKFAYDKISNYYKDFL